MSEYTDAVDAARRGLEAALVPDVAAAFRLIGEAAADAYGAAEDWEAVFSDSSEVVEDVVLAVWTEAATAFADVSYDALVPPAKIDPPDYGTWGEQVREFLFEGGFLSLMVTSITDTLRDRFRAVIEVVVGELGPEAATADVVSEIRAAWPDVAQARAAVVVETEVVGASNYGVTLGADAAKQAVPEGFEKVWDAVLDGDTRETHAAANGQRVPFEEPFSLGPYRPMWPGHPSLPIGERAQCRCTVSFFPAGQTTRSAKDRRDAAIREAYPDLKAEHGSSYALWKLAEEHAVSERTVERALGWG